jgi:hypothetical protein
MMKIASLTISLLITSSLYAFVPSVESLFRHGSNPDVTANGVMVTLSLKKIDSQSTVNEKDSGEVSRPTDFYRLFFTKINSETMKVAQAHYDNASFNDNNLKGKIYYPNFSAYTVKGMPEDAMKGIFFMSLRSIIFNDGTFLLNYLKTAGVPVKLNNEIINYPKREYLNSYKRYLSIISKDRASRRTEQNPLKPEDPAAREKVELVMNEPMYLDQKQVKLATENGEVAWMINAGPFEAAVSYKEREIQRIKYKSQLGDFDIYYKDYWLANGTHAIPRFIVVKDYKGEMFQLEVLNMKHYLEREADLILRLKKWDGILRGKEAANTNPPFLL